MPCRTYATIAALQRLLENSFSRGLILKTIRSVFCIGIFVLLTGLAAASSSMAAQPDQSLPIPGQEAAKDIPGAKELPQPDMVYKVVFDIGKAAPKIDDVNPGLVSIARYVNTLAKNGVPADHRKIVVVFHQGGTDIVQNNEAFKERNDGHDNPNIELIQNMKKAGVDFRVCGQAILARKIDPKAIMPEVQLDLWALTTLVNLQLEGYVHVGGN